MSVAVISAVAGNRSRKRRVPQGHRSALGFLAMGPRVHYVAQTGRGK
jgi:hypothetical protein